MHSGADGAKKTVVEVGVCMYTYSVWSCDFLNMGLKWEKETKVNSWWPESSNTQLARSKEDKRQSSGIKLLADPQDILVDCNIVGELVQSLRVNLFRWMKLYVKFDKVQAMNSSGCRQQSVWDFHHLDTFPIKQNGFNTRSPCGHS